MLSKVSNRFLAVTILAIFVIALVGIISNKSLESSKLASTEVKKNSSVPASEQVSKTEGLKGYLQVMVVDSKTGIPVEGANVVFSNLDQLYTTGKDGKTQIIPMQIKASESSKFLSQPYEEVVIGVFKQGYADYILMGSKVRPTTQDKPQLKIIRVVKASTPTTTPVFAMEKYSADVAKEVMNKMKEKLNSLANTSQEVEEIEITE
ncbi:hypothetical protein B0S90_1724 [Caldicellulosiruptor bescii]|uniref:Uncharacterized protein n=2 Tax=Caldicellulosiruptor bescii TaxID=31899 RepID=B9MS78_CALBD|nr:hypothetical protein [Caldicellulosiruptor bescii]ACM60532.1 conserved hypothetical protein [Caldicellulosiruptor bescii DSM 6725]PBC87943.1 hypothetical protein B0S87_0864 [Caldicellulosiruptor bescii]PBC90875.1 hypothetical protein B0S89_1226 [Caldicellulosiruptor bescii]PBD03693.1 hypothetical protein B0S85_1313 [Caldicellulosiruptor bescii]PBD06673.1 hypothetical protein B0S90_1724 [Caldicellulosiruptor bescii]